MYRDPPPAGPCCARHPVAVAVERCARCRQDLCEPCVLYTGPTACCFLCVRTITRRRRVRAAGRVVVASVVALAMFAQLGRSTSRNRMIGGDPRWAALERAAHGSCDRDATLRFEMALLRADAVPAMLQDGLDYREHCGSGNPGLALLRYRVFEKIGQPTQAAVEASDLLEGDPNNVEYLVLRAHAFALLGDHGAAARDYRAALTLAPERRDVAAPLADQLTAQGQLCEARAVLANSTSLTWRPEDDRDPSYHRLRRFMYHLSHAGRCFTGLGRIVHEGEADLRDPDDVE